MARDLLQRRLPWAGPVSTGRMVVPQERDILYFEAIQRHGPLPSTYLYELTKHLASNYNQHQKRLTLLANEERTPHGGRYLDRPWQQFQTVNARSNPVVAELTPAATALLRERGTATRYAVPPGGPSVHRFMTAAITASIELAARDAGVGFIDQEAILRRHSCPEATRAARNPLAIALRAGGVLIPDQLFGLEYPGPDGKPRYRFFALEADRGTEPIRPRDLERSSIARKLAGYLEARQTSAFHERFGIPNLLVLTVTTSATRIDSMLALLGTLTGASPEGAAGMLFKSRPEFGRYWQSPPVMGDLFTDPWTRTTAPFAIDGI